MIKYESKMGSKAIGQLARNFNEELTVGDFFVLKDKSYRIKC